MTTRGVVAMLALALAWAGAFPLRAEGPPTAAEAIERPEAAIGKEVAVPRHLADGDEYRLARRALLDHGQRLFEAMWTSEEGGGRPLTKGNGRPLVDPSEPLVFPRNFNRISAPDANSCFGCHHLPRSGGGGDIVANVFVLGQRFDHVTFDPTEPMATKASHDERGRFATLPEIANSRATLGMFGSGYVEMLARQMTAELQRLRDAIRPGGTARLVAKGVSFGVLRRTADGRWDVAAVEGLGAASLKTGGAADPPSLVVRPFHQAGAVVSLREFSNNAFNHHHGIQASERFGAGTDPDGDGFADEMTRADATAVSLWQATLPPPGRVIPRSRPIEEAVLDGERLFATVGCSRCHVPSLPLGERGWVFSEPNPYNPPGNLRPGDAPALEMDLNAPWLPGPRLQAVRGVTEVAAYTDLKLHDITGGPGDPNREPLDMHATAGSEAFFEGNGRFLTKKLWGAANEPPYFHHGLYTTMREAILAHAGEAEAEAGAFRALAASDQDALVEFLKTLRLLPEHARALIVDERGQPREWPPAWAGRR